MEMMWVMVQVMEAVMMLVVEEAEETEVMVMEVV